MLQSANDAAAAIAIEVAGSIEAFADMMNRRAGEMGLRDTHFANPHGLDDSEHYTTAKELAIIAAEALICAVKGVNRVLYDITSKPPATVEFE